MQTVLSALLTVVLLSHCAAKDVDEGKPTSSPATPSTTEFKFDGVWKPKGAMLSGTLLPPPALEAISLRITGNRYEVTVEGEPEPDRGTFELDESVTPCRMTIKSESGPNKGNTILAIYEIKGPNAMRACYDLSGRVFPTEFQAPKETQFYLVGYRRQVEGQ